MNTVALALNLPTALPQARLEVVITIAAGQSAPMYVFGILTRGSHPAAVALRDGRDFFGYLLTVKEQRSICTRFVECQGTEDPALTLSRPHRRKGTSRSHRHRLWPTTPNPASTASRTWTRGKRGVQVMPEFELTLLTTRGGMSVAHITAETREAALNTVRAELASGDHIAPPEHCTDDVQTEVWAIREGPVKEVRDAHNRDMFARNIGNNPIASEPQRCPF